MKTTMLAEVPARKTLFSSAKPPLRSRSNVDFANAMLASAFMEVLSHTHDWQR